MKAGFLLIASLLVSCGSLPTDPQTFSAPETEADHPHFKLVEDAMGKHCATLDCHGQVGRNFRFYWFRGLRLADTDVPGDGDTSEAEYTATYRSLIALEPFVVDAVVKGKAPPEALTVVRKARGAENHKGAAQWTAGSDPDRCLVQWLVGAFDDEACKRAAAQ